MALGKSETLEGKVSVVTGGSRGLGRAMACALAEAGSDMVIVGRDETALAGTAEELRALGREVVTIAADLGDPRGCQEAFATSLEAFGHVDILVNNVGSRLNPAPIEEEPLSAWQAAMDLNLTSCFLGTQALGRAMIDRQRGGRIINIASMNAFISNRGIGGRSYETSKAAIVQFTRSAAADWAHHGITVNAICPGLFMTDANRKWQETKPEVIEGLVANVPMGRPGEPEELGPLVVYLAGSGSSYMTGASIVIDGGYTLW